MDSSFIHRPLFVIAAIVGILALSITGYAIGIDVGLPSGSPDRPTAENATIMSFTWSSVTCGEGDGYIRVNDVKSDVGRRLVLNVSFKTDAPPSSLNAHLQQQDGKYVLTLTPRNKDNSECRFVTYRSTVQLPEKADTLEVRYDGKTEFIVEQNGVSAKTGPAANHSVNNHSIKHRNL